MAEEYAKNAQYQYVANSNLVTQADRSQITRRDNDPTGEPETLAGRITIGDFGSRAVRDKVSGQEIKKHKSSHRSGDRSRRKDEDSRRNVVTNSVLNVSEDFEGLNYRPKTQETKSLYEMLLTFVSKRLGDQSHDILRSATDTVLEILKDENMKDSSRKSEIDSIIGTITVEELNQLLNVSRKINDYKSSDQKENGETQEELDDELGVAVVFDDEDEDEDQAGGQFEVKDSSEDEDEEDQNGEADIDQAYPSFKPVNGDSNGDLNQNRASATSKDTVHPHEIHAHWLQKQIKEYFSDSQEAESKTLETKDILFSDIDARECENQLMQAFDFDQEKFSLINRLIKNRDVIVWCTRLSEVGGPQSQEYQNIASEMTELGLDWILKAIRGGQEGSLDSVPATNGESSTQSKSHPTDLPTSATTKFIPKSSIDLDDLIFKEGNHLLSKEKCVLPAGTTKTKKKEYEEIQIPIPTRMPDPPESLISTKKLPEWAQESFKGMPNLNRVQSEVFPSAFGQNDNILLCAPTGAGKTNVAMLTILNEINKHFDEETKTLNLNNFKIVYIAPMKALVQEMVNTFTRRLSYLDIKVAELTGDSQLTKQQIAETQIIVTTPEKWDVITRKANDRSYTNLVRLIIIDEIHLLHDDRGPILENIVVRSLRHMEQTQTITRLVGLSATLPNYQDVADFLRVPESNVFFFDSKFRPCPLKQNFIGVSEKKAIKRFQVMNEVTYEKVMEQAGKNQVLIFVHSRKETVRTAAFLRDAALDRETIGMFVKPESASRAQLENEAEQVIDQNLKELLPYGFAVHHAGMKREDRTVVEELFLEKHIQVLVSTATLAWGVNLPAHTVIIKGTQIYSPEKGRWVELSPQDVLQMLGRAGRPQFDSFGEGIIITTLNELQYYLSLLNTQLPIESQLVSKLTDSLNAEISLGTIRNREDAVQWLGYSYLYIRMLRNPSLYMISPSEYKEDPTLVQRRTDLVHAAALLLDQCQLVKYDRKTGRFQGTELGRIASHYYISHRSMATYNQHLKPTMSFIELFRAFSLSDEFKYIPIREEEKLELAKLLERVPIPVKESVEEPVAKINVLLQAYISQLKLDGFALMADMVYVTQSAGRILRSIFEMCLKKGWANLARLALDMCKMVEKRSWLSMSPLRQFSGLDPKLINRLERKDFSWSRYLDLNPEEIGELIGIPKAGRVIHKFLHKFPKLELRAYVQSITRSLLKIELTIIPDFQWDDKIHGNSEGFWILVEDLDGENVLYYDYFVLKKAYATEEHYNSFTIPLSDPMPPNCFVTLLSDRWLHSEAKLPISFKHLILPERYPPHTELYDMHPLPTSGQEPKELFEYYANEFSEFNPIQTQTFHALYKTNDNVFLGAPTGSGKTICAEFAILKVLSQTKPGERPSPIVYLVPNDDLAKNAFVYFTHRFRNLEELNVVQFTGELSADFKQLVEGDIIITTPTQWDGISRKWKTRERIQRIRLFICDEIHMVGGDVGPTYEAVVSRMRYMNSQLNNKIRFVALSVPLSNSKDMANWLGVSPQTTFNFSPIDRPIPLEVHIQSFQINHFASLMISMSKPAYQAIGQYSPNQPVIIFVPNRKQCRITASDIITHQYATSENPHFLHCKAEEMEAAVEKISDPYLKESLLSGIGLYHEALSPSDRNIVSKLYLSGWFQVLIASRDTCWSMNHLTSHMVIIMGAQYFEGKEHRYVDYPVTDMLQMMGRANRPLIDQTGQCLLMCNSNKKEYYKKFIEEALPVESHLDHFLHDFFNAEISVETIENKQDAVDCLTYTFLFRRISQNPTYYNIQGITPTHISNYLSELVEDTLNQLSESGCIQIDEDEVDVHPLNLGMIAAFYNIQYTTLDSFALSLTNRTKLRGLLEIISAASEFETLPIRHHEDNLLRKLYDRLPVKLTEDKLNLNLPNVKTHILLQSHFSRTQLPADLQADQTMVISQIIPLLQGCVDVISSKGWLNPALATMELCQMIVQAMWDKDSPLRQIPYFDMDRIAKANKMDVESVFDFIDLDDSDRKSLLKDLTNPQLRKVADFVNTYPSLELNINVLTPKDELRCGEKVQLHIQIERDGVDEDEISGSVNAPYYPKLKDENWWIVVGSPTENLLLGIKRFNLKQILNLKLEFEAPASSSVGPNQFKVYLMSDSYLGCDQELDLNIDLLEALSEDEDSEDADE